MISDLIGLFIVFVIAAVAGFCIGFIGGWTVGLLL